ncbi:MAG: methionine--tRNA ligase [Fimbriimonadaceae bacterium]|nr:methionine--tRNA ligase [Fimbriimonadaceae bacterium]
MAQTFTITTPIYYVNSVPHVGHALTMLVCDAEAAYHRLRGEEVLFITGTDENGLKVKEAAEKAGEDAHAFVDRISADFRRTWDDLGFQYDDFIRTTEPRHARAVQRLFEILRDKGHIYQDKYEGWYDVSAETFVRESDLVDGKSPDGNEVRWVSEDNWFFRLSALGEPLMAHIEANPDFLLPASRKNEVVSFINQGLRDLCITRTNPGWGIPVPGDEGKVIYVWFDALINYIAATGWPDDPNWQTKWPAVHWMAKEIFTRFHATLWPAMLMAADLPLPSQVIAHGWFTFGKSKMSKSQGNVIAPGELRDFFVTEAGCSADLAVDAVRLCLARCLPYEGDTNFTWDEVAKHYNSDLANDLGNALNRSLTMIHKFAGGRVPGGAVEPEVAEAIAAAKHGVEEAYAAHRVDQAAESAIGLIRFLNKYIDTRAPWALAKAEDPALGSVLRGMALALASAAGLVEPLLPATAPAMRAQLGLSGRPEWAQLGAEETLPAGTEIAQPQPLFPRLDVKKLTAQVEESAPAEPKPKKEPKKPMPEAPAQIEFPDFMKVQLKVARIVEAERMEGSDKMMKLQVTLGGESRQIMAGIAKKYAPVDLIGRQVVVVANLKPARLMGQESQGMLLAADDVDGSPILLEPSDEAPDGSLVH